MLAILYHPDNYTSVGQHCNPMFQIIQAAHKVLGDKESRMEYDRKRKALQQKADEAPTAETSASIVTFADSASVEGKGQIFLSEFCSVSLYTPRNMASSNYAAAKLFSMSSKNACKQWLRIQPL
jgi:DnaJ-class molecular chaperone